MSALVGSGWLVAVVAVGLLGHERRAARRTAERVVRACHELRGPLTTVLLALDRPPARPGDLARAVATELVRARRACDEVSAAAARRRAPDERRPVDVAELARGLAAAHDAAARSVGRRVRFSGGPAVVLGDRARLAQAIGNLIHNAIEHGAGTVTVATRATAVAVRIEVCDQGPGLPVPVAALMRRPRRGQRGRGMRIVRDALAAHGGTLRAGPSPSGARLIAELPRLGDGLRAVAR
ncbi:sensor histidine kinase [Patulibacter defluvii]|uniref:sensor histidine kinase n=1 Tax=Patulibacter defluvii TaxID=3095358 RepID=UPI002A74BC2A|nr:HAMP domain-containing sensor histidine kinase [Patulibacter sp. DM4]